MGPKRAKRPSAVEDDSPKNALRAPRGLRLNVDVFTASPAGVRRRAGASRPRRRIALGVLEPFEASVVRRAETIRVAVGDERGHAVAPGLGAWLSRVAPSRARGTVNVAIVSDQRVRALNREYRGVDHATDVLSFPASADELKRFLPLGHAGSRPSLKRRRTADALHRSGLRRCLGDIVIARGVARRQARAMGHAESTEWRVLALHGLLHLLGYDHERDAGAMRRVEQRLRQKGGLPTGLIERAHR